MPADVPVAERPRPDDLARRASRRGTAGCPSRTARRSRRQCPRRRSRPGRCARSSRRRASRTASGSGRSAGLGRDGERQRGVRVPGRAGAEEVDQRRVDGRLAVERDRQPRRPQLLRRAFGASRCAARGCSPPPGGAATVVDRGVAGLEPWSPRSPPGAPSRPGGAGGPSRRIVATRPIVGAARASSAAEVGPHTRGLLGAITPIADLVVELRHRPPGERVGRHDVVDGHQTAAREREREVEVVSRARRRAQAAPRTAPPSRAAGPRPALRAPASRRRRCGCAAFPRASPSRCGRSRPGPRRRAARSACRRRDASRRAPGWAGSRSRSRRSRTTTRRPPAGASGGRC